MEGVFRGVRSRALELLDQVGLAARTGEKAGALSYGEQRLVGVALALASDPLMLLLDEPVSGMNASETQVFVPLIRGIRDDGVTILLVEHDMPMVMAVAERRAQAAGTLSGGEQQMLAIGRGLMARPKLVLFDEPSLGLAPKIVERMFSVIRAICDAGTTVLLVEQNVLAALELCDYAYLLETGCIVFQGAGQALIADPQVRDAYLGG